MYSLYKKAATRCLFRTLSDICGYKKGVLNLCYNDDVPQVMYNNEEISVGIVDISVILYLFDKALQLYDMPFIRHKFMYTDKTGIMKKVKITYSKVTGILQKLGYGTWVIHEVFDFRMYTINNGIITRLFVMFLVDPLAFIQKMRTEIDQSHAKEFFDNVEYYVNKKIHTQLSKYYMWKNISQQSDVIDDIIRIVVYKWLELEYLYVCA